MPATTKTERLEARIPVFLERIIQHAADLQGRSLTDFVITSLDKSARETVRDHEVIKLNAEDSLIFAKALIDMKLILLILVCLFIPLAAALAGDPPLACEQIAVLAGKNGTLRAPNGSTLYTASTSGNRTTIRAANGATVATVEMSGNHAVFRAPNGSTMGNASTSGSSSTFRKPNGATTCSAQTSGNTTTFRAPNGSTQATASQSGSTITIRKPNGATAGTVSLSR